MMNLAEYRRRSQSLADFLPWAALVREGVDPQQGRLVPAHGANSAGRISNSATPAELVAITSRLNNALRRLGSGWAIFIEAQRQPAHSYPLERFSRTRLAGWSMRNVGPSSRKKARISRAGIS